MTRSAMTKAIRLINNPKKNVNRQQNSTLSCKSVLVTGGARSGKSEFAEQLVLSSGKLPIYLATAQALDNEMRDRIDAHKDRRSDDWQTVEEPIQLVDKLFQLSNEDNVLLIDCLTLWLSNMLQENLKITAEIDRLTSAILKLPGPIVLVSNEVGLGIVPDNQLARSFRDDSGILNKKLAEACDAVYFVAASQPLLLKPNLQPEIEL